VTQVRRAQRGFTLVELMISLVLFLVAIAGTLNIAVSMSQAYRDQRGVILTENSVRAPMDFISDAIRNSSPAVSTGAKIIAGLPSGSVQETMSSGCKTGAIYTTNSTSAPDELYIVYASGAVVTSLRSAYTAPYTSITVTDASQLNPGDYLLITDTTTGTVVQIGSGSTAVNTATGAITLTSPACTPTNSYALAGSPPPLVIRVKKARFYVDTAGSVTDGVPTLMMDPDADGPATAEPLAENIEDMQVALGVDVNASGGIDDASEWAYSNGTGSLDGNIRAVRVTLIARAPNQLLPLIATYQRPAAEDRPAATTFDTFRRRVLTSTIEIRNLGGSP
jgi:type IV pilus assembly protein PilW